MKQKAGYILLIVLGIFLAVLLFASARKRPRIMDERITLRSKDKIPYGFYVAYQLLPELFPNAKITQDRKSPGNWDSIDTASANQAVIFISKSFDADEYELDRILSFVNKGNYVFIITHNLSYEARDFFKVWENEYDFDFLKRDSLEVYLEKPPFIHTSLFQYPGQRFESSFSKIDSGYTAVLGRGTTNGVNFIHLKAGNGSIFLHVAPLAFSNYFLLHKNNFNYFQQVMAVIPSGVSKILWNDYYLTKLRKREEEPSIFRVLLRYPSFRWGLFTAIGTLLLFIVLEMRRKQRSIPLWPRPKNESLDFVKTIGRLYFDKGDHKNLAKKMATYFSEHIRSQYQIPTHTLDEAFIQTVHLKTSYPINDLKRLVRFIHFLDTAPAISEAQLSDFYKQLDLFYQNTYNGRTAII